MLINGAKKANTLFNMTRVSLSLLLLLHSFSAFTEPVTTLSKALRYKVIAEYPHNERLFTQGLEFHAGKLYESAGQYRQSSLSMYTLANIQAAQAITIDDQYFAEGISILNGKIYQLTWRAGKVFVYQADNLKKIQQLNYSGQGWGLCNNGHQLIMSNGSNILQFINPANFKTVRTLNVSENGKAVYRLNELEWVEGKIYANLWQSDRIVIINPNNGHVEGSINLSQLLPKELRKPTTNVLNGIAYDKNNKRLYVTGKYWPRLYEIEVLF